MECMSTTCQQKMGIAALQLAHMQLAEKAYPAITQTFTQVMTSTTIERSP
jgi:hypothetical protein